MILDYRSKFVFVTMFTLCMSTHTMAQISIKDELKKDLLKSVNPINDFKSNPLSQSYDNNVISKKDALRSYINKGIGVEAKPKYEVHPNAYTYFNKGELKELWRSNVTTVYEGGHFIQGMPIPTLGGFSFSVGGQKKVSEKDKKILKNVYGQEVEEK